MAPGSFSRQQVTAITRLVVPQSYTAGGHARYSFLDLLALRTARRLLDAKSSLQGICTCLQSLSRFLPTADRALAELSRLVSGDVVQVFGGERAFDALTGQAWVWSIAEPAAQIEPNRGQPPRQSDRFPADDRIAG